MVAGRCTMSGNPLLGDRRPNDLTSFPGPKAGRPSTWLFRGCRFCDPSFQPVRPDRRIRFYGIYQGGALLPEFFLPRSRGLGDPNILRER